MDLRPVKLDADVNVVVIKVSLPFCWTFLVLTFKNRAPFDVFFFTGEMAVITP